MPGVGSNIATREPEVWEDINSDPYIKVENVSKLHGETNILKGISFSVYKGELFSLLGQSGCGKTTLLRILSGLDAPTSGKITIDGVDVTNWPSYKRPVNMVFQ